MRHEACLFIGRANPFHEAHRDILIQAFDHAEEVIMVNGSAFQPRNERNAFLTHEIEEMVRGSLTSEQNDRFHFKPVRDTLYNETKWLNSVREAVSETGAEKVALIGHEKDGSSFYLKKFPDYSSIAVPSLNDGLSATRLRNAMYDGRWDSVCHLVPPSTDAVVRRFMKSSEAEELKREIEYYREYRAAHDAASLLIKQKLGYLSSIKLQTADACVIHAGHILLIQRKTFPGRGLWALPGGFLDDGDMSLLDCALRELKEETRLKVPVPVLKGSLITDKQYAHPYRSSRGRVITQAFLIHLSEDMPRPEAKPRSDARQAKWVPLNELDSNVMFEDHFQIITDLTSFL